MPDTTLRAALERLPRYSVNHAAREGRPMLADPLGIWLSALDVERTLATPEPSVSVEAGKRLHAAWRDGMLAQGREVAPERMLWDTLSEQDKALDAGIDAALRASVTPLPLDVERLADAMHAVAHPDHSLRGSDGEWCIDDVREDAAALAAEYARLSEAHDAD